MTYGEYWLFEAVVEGQEPLSFLMHPNMELLYNRPGHNLDRADLIGILRKHFDLGNLTASQEGCGDFIPTPSELDEALRYVALPVEDLLKTCYYALTAKGGHLWETVAQPNWSRYICAKLGGMEDSEGTELGDITSTDRDRVERYASGLQYLEYHIAPSSLRWERVAPWEATYWKTLPEGHRLQFRYKFDESVADWDWDCVPKWFLDFDRWYTRPTFDDAPPGAS